MEKTTIKSNRGAIRFSLKHSRDYLIQNRDVASPISIWFSFGGTRVKKSTGYSVLIEDWDFKKQRVRTNKISVLNARAVNNFLNELETKLSLEYSELLNRKVEIKKSTIQDILQRIFTNEPNLVNEKVEIDFFDFADEFLEQKRPTVHQKTYIIYNQTLVKLKKFSKKKRKKVTFNSFTRTFINDFKKFLEESEGLSLNTIVKHFKNLKMFVIEAQSQGLITDVQLKIFKLKTEETSSIYLNEEEIEKFHKYDLSFSPEMDLSRDIFLMGCYTGQRISDYNGLQPSDIIEINGINYFKIFQKKTKQTVYCPITREIREIMAKYDHKPPPRLHDVVINRNIKEIGKLLEFDSKVKCQITRGGKTLVDFKPKYEMIHTHTARRSFCTNMYIKKMRVTDIMHFSGHKTEREFQKYIRIQDEERTNHIVGMGYFNL